MLSTQDSSNLSESHHSQSKITTHPFPTLPTGKSKMLHLASKTFIIWPLLICLLSSPSMPFFGIYAAGAWNNRRPPSIQTQTSCPCHTSSRGLSSLRPWLQCLQNLLFIWLLPLALKNKNSL